MSFSFRLIFLLVSLGFVSISNVRAEVENSAFFTHQQMQVSIPYCPLADESLRIEPQAAVLHFTDWNRENHESSYALIRNIAYNWKEEGIHDYLIYGKEVYGADSGKFYWEVIPFHGWKRFNQFGRFWNHFKLLKKVVFGPSCLSEQDLGLRIQNFQKIKEVLANSFDSSSPPSTLAKSDDPFCQDEVIVRQSVFDANPYVTILYNFAPIGLGKEKLHFLIIPKQHRHGLTDLTKEEYQESMILAAKLISFYQKKGYPSAYLLHKTGAEAGQTVPHWHLHVIFTANAVEEYAGKFMILKRMLIGSSPLSSDELEKRVKAYREELAPVLAPSLAPSSAAALTNSSSVRFTSELLIN